MKIALVAQHSTPVPGTGTSRAGDDARLVEMSRSLAGEGHQVTVYARRNGAPLPERASLAPGVSVEYVGPADSGADDSHLVRQVGAFSAAAARGVGQGPPRRGARAALDQRPGRPVGRPRPAGPRRPVVRPARRHRAPPRADPGRAPAPSGSGSSPRSAAPSAPSSPAATTRSPT